MKHAPWPKLACAGVVGFLLSLGALEAAAAPSGWLNVDGSIRFIAANGGTYDWANSGAAGAACANGGVNITGAGGLFNCGRPGAAGAPPIAPTLTPAAAADPSIISAVFVVDPISGDTAGCGGDDPTTLSGGGPKNGDAIGSYTVGAGPVPAKTELSNVYAVSHTKANGHPEIYFGAERLVNNGDSHMDFEFLQSAVGRTAACGGGFTGHRTQGDLLVAVDFTNGGALAGFSVWQWHCATDPGPQPADGTVCDPAGGPEHHEQNLSPTFADLTVNSADIPCGGWVCRDQVSGNSTIVSANDFLEGGVDLQGIPFTGCFNTFLPHTRTAQSFSSVLKDFAGPIGFKSCRDPATVSTSAPGGQVAPGSAVRDAVTEGSGGAGFVPTGTVRFFLCSPAQVTGAGCPGGTAVGAAKTLAAGAASSDPTSATNAAGKYCWRTAYTPDAASTGVYAPATHTNATTECFAVAAPVSLPNTGVPPGPAFPWLPVQAFAVGPLFLLAVALRRSRWLAILVLAVVMACSSPAPASVPPNAGGPNLARSIPQIEPSASAPVQPATQEPKQMAWRLVIPRIGVDAVIQPLGRDRHGAVASPSTLDGVGWFDESASPGRAGDAVIDGHLGLPGRPAVFRSLRLLRAGDEVHVIWPDGRTVDFRVTSSETVDANAHPAGLFARGPARLSLITCAGEWVNALATYSDRLIVTAVPA